MAITLSSPPKHIAVLRLSALGDVCHTLPVVRTIQAAWPETKISWIIGKAEALMLGDIPGIDFVVYDKSSGKAGRVAVQRYFKQHPLPLDIVLHMQASLRSSHISRLLKAPIKLGFDKARAKDYQWLFTNQRIAAQSQQHVMDGLYGFADALGIKREIDEWNIPLASDVLDEAKVLTKELTSDQPYLLISPCSSDRANNFRNWRAEYYADIVDFVAKEYNMATVLTGGNTELEQQYGDDISRLADSPVINLIGKTNLKTLLAVISQSSAVLCPDSGPAHIGNAYGRPILGLYASSNPQRTGPYNSQQWVINKYPEAVEKYLNKTVDEVSWGQRVRAPDVMELIQPDDVKNKLRLLFA